MLVWTRLGSNVYHTIRCPLDVPTKGQPTGVSADGVRPPRSLWGRATGVRYPLYFPPFLNTSSTLTKGRRPASALRTLLGHTHTPTQL